VKKVKIQPTLLCTVCREKLKEFNTLEQVVAKIKEAKNIIGGHGFTIFGTGS
jgi:cytidine deaminase